MFCYRDMTFCSRACKKQTCSRNKIHIPNDLPDWMPVAFADFHDCKDYKETKGGNSESKRIKGKTTRVSAK